MNDVSGCLMYHVDGSLIFWSIQGDRTVISNPVSVDSNHVKADDKVCHLYGKYIIQSKFLPACATMRIGFNTVPLVPAGRLSGAMHSNKKR
jgi:hypothetical protein